MSLEKIQEDITTIKITMQRIADIQERQAADLKYHIKRTDLLEKKQNECPARVNAVASKSIVDSAKDITVILGLAVIILKMFGIINWG